MEYLTPSFKKEMMKDYTVLIPNMAPIQFGLIKPAMESEGYHVEVLEKGGPKVAQLGLKYVHNDTCYPALVVIGQFLEAIESGKYDLDHTALMITQTGGGCRASNYIKLLRKALVKSGHANIPVASVNASGLEKDSTMPYTIRMLMKLIAACYYGDLIAALRNQVKPYENNEGDAERMVAKWTERISGWMHADRRYTIPAFIAQFKHICADFASIPVTKVPKVKVGVVGEIYVKFSPIGNNHLADFLEANGCEVNMPGIIGFLQYCTANMFLDIDFYGGKRSKRFLGKFLTDLMDWANRKMYKAMREAGFYAPESFAELMKKPGSILSLGTKMGEGWLLTGEMVELIEGGYDNIICAQPFGCLPNHICGKGVINQIRAKYPEANITPIDYDPSASAVNQENRIRLMLAVAREKMGLGEGAAQHV